MANTWGRRNARRIRYLSASLGILCLFHTPLALGTSDPGQTAGQPLQVARYAVVPLDPDDIELEHLVINDRGQIAGTIRYDQGHYDRGCFWKDRKLIRLPGLDGNNSQVSAINNRGQIVGMAEDRAGNSHLALWQNGRLRLPVGLGHIGGYATDINDRGEIVGLTLHGEASRILFRNGRRVRMRRIRVQRGLVVVSANAINNRGVIAGCVASRGTSASKLTERPCLIKNGRAVCYGPVNAYSGNYPVDLNDYGMVVGQSPALEATTVFTIRHGKFEALARDFYHGARAINNAGQYVGWLCQGGVIQDGPFRAILWQAGRKYDLNNLIPRGTGWVLMHADGINNRGVIVGTGTYNSRRRAFKLTPL